MNYIYNHYLLTPFIILIHHCHHHGSIHQKKESHGMNMAEKQMFMIMMMMTMMMMTMMIILLSVPLVKFLLLLLCIPIGIKYLQYKIFFGHVLCTIHIEYHHKTKGVPSLSLGIISDPNTIQVMDDPSANRKCDIYVIAERVK